MACGTGIILVLQKWIPQYLCHFVENGIFLNPLWICPVFMYSLPTWREEFQKAFPRRNKRKLGVIKVEQVEDVKKRIAMETDIYFNQLNTFWSPQ
ncbi:hypothetical protein CAEBREN_29890 [Caenorhabditis brenneri]|uniref:Uncharacterized protein n=1 Tax=Caenorhabditis brenneri TaxID=135651 RepID=G0MUU6_CAEBE|nr:hypothetical protein CAEBREN_29890 [Caenorhabditis brenneri]